MHRSDATRRRGSRTLLSLSTSGSRGAAAASHASAMIAGTSEPQQCESPEVVARADRLARIEQTRVESLKAESEAKTKLREEDRDAVAKAQKEDADKEKQDLSLEENRARLMKRVKSDAFCMIHSCVASPRKKLSKAKQRRRKNRETLKNEFLRPYHTY